jgi:hypothetical protein
MHHTFASTPHYISIPYVADLSLDPGVCIIGYLPIQGTHGFALRQ